MLFGGFAEEYVFLTCEISWDENWPGLRKQGIFLPGWAGQPEDGYCWTSTPPAWRVQRCLRPVRVHAGSSAADFPCAVR